MGEADHVELGRLFRSFEQGTNMKWWLCFKGSFWEQCMAPGRRRNTGLDIPVQALEVAG